MRKRARSAKADYKEYMFRKDDSSSSDVVTRSKKLKLENKTQNLKEDKTCPTKSIAKEQGIAAKKDSSALDLVFAMDCTGSMAPYIQTAQDNIRQIVEAIVASEKSNVRLALVEYRDHPPQDKTFVTRTHLFTTSVNTMKGWLDQCYASGGGDMPEAVADALYDVLNLNWRPHATKVCVLISDAPPHGLSENMDSFPYGCPKGLDPMEISHKLAEKDVVLYSVGCEPSIVPYKDFFVAISYVTGGQYVPLASAGYLTNVIIGCTQEEISLQQWMADVDEEIERELEAGRDIDEEEITTKIQNKLKRKGAKSKHLTQNNQSLPEPSKSGRDLANFKTMDDVKKRIKIHPAVNRVPRCSSPKGKSAKKGRRKTASRKLSKDTWGVVEGATSRHQVLRMVKKSAVKKKAQMKRK